MIVTESRIEVCYQDNIPFCIYAVIPEKVVSYYKLLLKKYLSPEEYTLYCYNQVARDNGSHHMTVITPPELEKISNEYDKFIDYPIPINLIGIGKVKENDKEAFYIVSSCNEAMNVRKFFKLGPTDFHVTLAFKTGDIHDKPKGRNTLLFPFSYIENNE